MNIVREERKVPIIGVVREGHALWLSRRQVREDQTRNIRGRKDRISGISMCCLSLYEVEN
jgi:hypothetical protein